jgi:hypothetical protein
MKRFSGDNFFPNINSGKNLEMTGKMKENEGTTRQFRKGLVAFVVVLAVCRQVLMSFCIKCLEGREKGRTFAASKPINNCSVRH